MSGILSDIFEVGGLKQLELKELQGPMWRAHAMFDATRRLTEASSVLGCTQLKAITVLGIDSNTLEMRRDVDARVTR